MSPKSKAEAIKKQLIVINELLKKPENKYCADCKKIKEINFLLQKKREEKK